MKEGMNRMNRFSLDQFSKIQIVTSIMQSTMHPRTQKTLNLKILYKINIYLKRSEPIRLKIAREGSQSKVEPSYLVQECSFVLFPLLSHPYLQYAQSKKVVSIVFIFQYLYSSSSNNSSSKC